MSIESINQIECPKCRDECDELLGSIVSEGDFDVIPVDEFSDYMHMILKNIDRWYTGEVLPEEVVALMRMSKNRQKLNALQAESGYSYLQIQMWAGEMKLQLIERRAQTVQALARVADTLQTVSDEAE